MADDITLNSGSGGSVVAADDVASVFYQRVKLVDSADGSTKELSKVEDSAHTTGDPGIPVMVVRQDTATSLAGTDGDYSMLIVDANGRLHVLDQNSAAVKTAAEAIQTAVEGTLTVGSHAVTNAGTFAVQVDGDALTSLQLIDNLVLAEDAVHGTGDPGVQMLAVRNDVLAALAGTDGDYAPLQVNASGALFIQEGSALDVSAATVTVDGSGVTQPVSGTVTANLSATDNAVLDTIDAVLDTINAKLVSGTVIGDVNLGATDNAVLDSIVTNTTGLAGTVSGSELQVDVVAALPAGTNAIGKLAANSGVDIGDVDVTSIAAGSNLIGDVGIQGRTTGGLSIYYDNDLDETAVAVKASAGTLYAIHAINTTAAPLYLQLFNVAQGSVTVGTTTPTVQFIVPGNADSDGAGFTFSVPQGIAFGTAITAAASTDNEGNGAPGANAMHCNLFYK